MQRVELAWHTGYSRMNGIGLGNDIVEFAVENNIKTVVVTDAGNVDGYMDIQQSIMRKAPDTKLIMGADLNIFDDRDIEGKSVTSGRLSVLIRNEIGKKNLYMILSVGEKKYRDGHDEPQIPLSLLLDNREGLLIGSGSENGLLVHSLDAPINGNNILEILANNEFDKNIYSFLDYIEIPAEGVSSAVMDELLRLSDCYRIPAVATCAPRYMCEEESKAYSVLRGVSCNGVKHYRDTEDMLEEFDFLGKEKAYEIVVSNSNLIADMCEEVSAVPSYKMYPKIENQDEILKDICEKSLTEKYKEVTVDLRNRLDWELNAIKNSSMAFLFIQIKDVIDRLGLLPFEIGSRGLVGSSLVAYLCGISEIDPIKAKLSPYFLLGFKGDREPDIDINFRPSIQKTVHKAFDQEPGVGAVIKAGIIGTISEKFAEELINSYSNEHDRYFSETEKYKIKDSLAKCVKTRGQHPGGIIILPKGTDVIDICPITCVNTKDGFVETSAFEYYCIDHITYKFDALGHNSSEIIKRLYDLTGKDPREISTEDPEVMQMFTIKDEELPACAGIPEFNSEFVINAMKVAECKTFNDLVKLCGLMHGTDVWIGNAENLIKEGVASISEVLADRNDVYDTLLSYGIDEETSFRIAEDVRKGKISRGKSSRWSEWKITLYEHNVPEWFIWSCEKISYMFPRAHTYSYMLASWRMAWYKLHYPMEFYKVMLEVRCKDGFDAEHMAFGKEGFEEFAKFIRSDYAANTSFVMDARQTCMLLHDYYDHGFSFRVSDNQLPDGETFRIADAHTIEVDGSKYKRNPDSYDEDEMYFF